MRGKNFVVKCNRAISEKTTVDANNLDEVVMLGPAESAANAEHHRPHQGPV